MAKVPLNNLDQMDDDLFTEEEHEAIRRRHLRETLAPQRRKDKRRENKLRREQKGSKDE